MNPPVVSAARHAPRRQTESTRGIFAIFFPLPKPLANKLFGSWSSVNSSKVQVLVYLFWVTL